LSAGAVARLQRATGGAGGSADCAGSRGRIVEPARMSETTGSAAGAGSFFGTHGSDADDFRPAGAS